MPHQCRVERNILRSFALIVLTGVLTLYQTISRSLPSVLKLHLRVTASPITTGGRGSMVTVKYPGKQRSQEKWVTFLKERKKVEDGWKMKNENADDNNYNCSFIYLFFVISEKLSKGNNLHIFTVLLFLPFYTSSTLINLCLIIQSGWTRPYEPFLSPA